MKARKRDEKESTVLGTVARRFDAEPAGKTTTPAVIVLELPPNLIWEMLLKERCERMES